MRPRVIPVLLIDDRYMVKTTSFRKPVYVGDPVNAVKILNDKSVDELFIIDITRGMGRPPDFGFIRDVASEAFMPVAYGGGITTVAQAEQLFSIGVEKVLLNEVLFESMTVATEISRTFGSQAVVGNIDVGRRRFGGRTVLRKGRLATGLDPVSRAQTMVSAGIGELLLTASDREGSRSGYDTDLIRDVTQVTPVPVVANGGAGSLEDIARAIEAGASAAAAGSMFIFHGPRKAVLITYPTDAELTSVLNTAVAE